MPTPVRFYSVTHEEYQKLMNSEIDEGGIYFVDGQKKDDEEVGKKEGSDDASTK